MDAYHDGVYEDQMDFDLRLQQEFEQEMEEMSLMYQEIRKEEAIRDSMLDEISISITGISYFHLDEVLDQCQLQAAHDAIDKAYALELSK